MAQHKAQRSTRRSSCAPAVRRRKSSLPCGPRGRWLRCPPWLRQCLILAAGLQHQQQQSNSNHVVSRCCAKCTQELCSASGRWRYPGSCSILQRYANAPTTAMQAALPPPHARSKQELAHADDSPAQHARVTCSCCKRRGGRRGTLRAGRTPAPPAAVALHRLGRGS
jgi:hypothetical protein